MSLRHIAITTLALSVAAWASAGSVRAADLPVKAVKKAPDIPFFLLVDNRMTYSWQPSGTDPGAYSIGPNGAISGKTAKQWYSFTHFDAWAYGTNLLGVSYIKSDHNDPAGPCTNAGVIGTTPAYCSGASEFYGFFRSTFGWNELFDTKQFTYGPLHNISFEVGGDFETDNSYLAPAGRDVVVGLQFAFDLPYKGYFNFAPLLFWEYTDHDAFVQCGGFGGPIAYPAPGANCLLDGNRSYKPTWDLEANYYMDLGFLPPSMQYFAVSGRFGVIGPKGTDANPLPYAPVGSAFPNAKTAVEFNSEPIRLTFDASKAAWGDKYSHFVDVWVAYRYWQNKYGFDHTVSTICNIAPGVSNNSCTESSVYTGVTVKF